MGLVLASVGLAIMGATLFYFDTGHYLQLGRTPIERAANEAGQPLMLGLSTTAETQALADCMVPLQQLNSLEMRFQPAGTADAIKERCREKAELVSRRTPTLSLAWYIKAMLGAIDGDAQALNDNLTRSRAVAPSEQWLAERRIALGEDNFSILDAEGLRSHKADLALMVQSSNGLRSLSRRYIQDPNFRERVASVVETMPQDVQARFLASLQRAIRNASS